MRFAAFRDTEGPGLAIVDEHGGLRGLRPTDAGYPGSLETLVGLDRDALEAAAAALRAGPAIDVGAIEWLPPIARPGKIVCVGLNYADHTAESGFKQPDYPTLFARFTSSLVGHDAPVVRPRVSEQFDYEGELVAVIGKGGRHIPRETALDHVFGWSVFNDVSVRDYQFKSPQWTMGKNFDATGAFGPWLVTADEVPAGGKGLTLETRLNGEVVQHTTTDLMIATIPQVIAYMSTVLPLLPGDVIVSGTPGGIGAKRTPPLWMKAGDMVEVEISKIGILSNPIADEAA